METKMEGMTADPRQGKPSGSSFDRLVACPGSAALITSLPPREETPDPDAERGTRLHQAWKRQDPTGLPAEDLPDYESGLTHITALVSAWQMQTGVYNVQELPREEREWLFNDELSPLLSGEMDRRYLGTLPEGTKAMLILDTKSGWLTYVPQAASSWQLRCYAVIEAYNHPLQTIRVAFVKPKSKAEPVDYVDYDATDLQMSRQAVLYHLWEVKRPEAVRSPGQQCRFCPAKAFCPEAGAYYLLPSVQARENGLLDVSGRVAAMMPGDLVRIWEAMPIIQRIGEEVKARLKGFSDEELALLGMKRAKPKQLDTIADTKGAFLEMRELLPDLVSRDGIWPAISFSKGTLTEILQQELGLTQKDARQWIADKLAAFIEKKQSEPSLVKL